MAGAVDLRRQRTQGTTTEGGRQVNGVIRLSDVPKLDGDVLTIKFRIHSDPLHGRRCFRCEGQNFRAVVGAGIRSQAICDRFMDDDHEGHCGRVIKGTLKCGDWTDNPDIWDEASPSSVPLAVCLDCGRLCRLV